MHTWMQSSVSVKYWYIYSMTVNMLYTYTNTGKLVRYKYTGAIKARKNCFVVAM